MAARGGLWEQANQVYREILETAPYTLIQSGAIAGLGRHGDHTAIPVIAAALAGEQGASLEPAALEAFRSLEGRDVRNALAALFPDASPTMQAGILVLFGDQPAPEYAALLAEYAKHQDESLRTAARRALRRSGSPDSASIFQEILEEASQQTAEWRTERDAALESLGELALRLQQAGDEAGAGRAWLAVYRHAEDEDMREAALNGIRNNPVPEAFEVVLDLLAAGDIDSLPVDTMMGIALNAIAQGREEEGRGLMDEILPRLTTADAVQRAVHTMRARGLNPEFARLIGVLNRWHFTGPFPWNPATAFTENFIGEPDIALDAVYTVDGRRMQWHMHESQDAGGIFDLSSTIANVENAAAFAYAEIEVEEGGPAQVRVGSDDGLRIWINGALVHENDVDRGAALDQDVADIELNAGRNTILTLITQRGGGWAFCLRLTDPDGKPLRYHIAP